MERDDFAYRLEIICSLNDVYPELGHMVRAMLSQGHSLDAHETTLLWGSLANLGVTVSKVKLLPDGT